VSKPFDRLRERLAEVYDLGKAATLLGWDERVMMPPAGSGARAEALATVGRLTQQRFIDPEIGRLLEELRPLEESSEYDSFEASLIRVTRRQYEKATRVPPELVGEIRRAAALGVAAWGPAKQSSDFDRLRPHLEQQLELRRQYIACFPPADEAYDVLLDIYEPEMKSAEVREIFEGLKEELRPLIRELADAGEVDDSFLYGAFDVETQRKISLEVARAFGFDEREWRLDPTAHPFMTSPGAGDIRLTTNYRPDDLSSLFATMHEFGHGVYEFDVDAKLARTPLARGTSSALHESQSRMWENLVGRSRGFWRWFYPQLQPLFPETLGSVDEDAFVRAVSAIRPGLIRGDADEVTYGLHIILRFELEQELLAGTLAIRDLPETWNARMKQYLGVDVPDDAHGVLQDMHWSTGLFGYFPTYQLGNVISVQIWDVVRRDLGDVEEQFARGEFAPLREWLREHIYRHGSIYPPHDLLVRVTGSGLDPEPYLSYLQTKFA
jgi:carboxypeptidase Taq